MVDGFSRHRAHQVRASERTVNSETGARRFTAFSECVLHGGV